MSKIDTLEIQLQKSPKHWLVTGAAGFIGSHLLEKLLTLNQTVVGLDDLSTGSQANIDQVLSIVGKEKATKFRFIKGSITDPKLCQEACKNIDMILHQAALGSVSRSIKDPTPTNHANIDGFVCLLEAARKASIKKIVYASSSSVYGDSKANPKREQDLGTPLSPYAVTKRTNELYARVYSSLYGISILGLRYFNVFGPRQNPQGEYAAVIPRWIQETLESKSCEIYGDGLTSRDFCYIDNVVQANLLAACSDVEISGTEFNIALGDETTLNQLHGLILKHAQQLKGTQVLNPQYKEFRAGDVRQSRAEIAAACETLGYDPVIRVDEGIRKTVQWFLGRM